MKQWFYAFWMCFGMFCGVPCPVRIWDEQARPRMISCLPLVGLVIGGFWALLAWLMTLLHFPKPLFAAVMTAAPWLLSGCIHLDGYMDCCDAIFSRRDLTRRQEILKDSHCGAFAVIGMVLLAMVSFSVWLSVEALPYPVLILLPAAVRAGAAIGVSTMKPLGHSQYAHVFEKRKTPPLALVCLILFCALAAALCGVSGLAPAIGCLGYLIFVRYAAKQLGGISGDISGFALTLGELCGTAALVFLA